VTIYDFNKLLKVRNYKGTITMKILRFLLLIVLLFTLNGCFLTKIVTVPMRVGAAVISIVPVVGNTAHDAIDEAAQVVDEIPL